MVGCGEYGICGWVDIFEKCAGCRMVEALVVDDAQLVDEGIGGAQETGWLAGMWTRRGAASGTIMLVNGSTKVGGWPVWLSRSVFRIRTWRVLPGSVPSVNISSALQR